MTLLETQRIVSLNSKLVLSLDHDPLILRQVWYGATNT